MNARSRAVTPMPEGRRRLLLAAGILAALTAVLVVALVARGGSASSARGSVDARKTALGTVLVTRSGRTLYLFAKDMNGRSACTSGACASSGRRSSRQGRPTAGGGVKPRSSARSAGVDARQVTYAGHPLYTFALDKAAGQAKGEGLNDFGGKWSAVSAAGRKVTRLRARARRARAVATATAS